MTGIDSQRVTDADVAVAGVETERGRRGSGVGEQDGGADGLFGSLTTLISFCATLLGFKTK